MKFNSSAFKDRYDAYWDEQVVSAYDDLVGNSHKGHTRFFSAPHLETHRLLKKYCDGVMTIVNNLIRQADDFEDKENVVSYLESTKTTACKDLSEFSAKLQRSAKVYPSSLALINATLAELARTSLVSSMDASSPEPISDKESGLSFVKDATYIPFSGMSATDMELFSGYEMELAMNTQAVNEEFNVESFFSTEQDDVDNNSMTFG